MLIFRNFKIYFCIFIGILILSIPSISNFLSSASMEITTYILLGIGFITYITLGIIAQRRASK